MKKILCYILLLVLACFLLPVFLTQNAEEKIDVAVNSSANENMENLTDNKQEKNYDYKEYNTIKLWHEKEQKIEEIALDEYLYGVVSAEMPASFEKEALKAQAVVARTYTIYKIQNNVNKHQEASICDESTCCQAWISKEDRFARWEENTRQSNWDKIVEAVDSTKGKIITYEGKPINAFFHSNSGGKTETTINVWGGDGYPYLKSVTTSGEDNYSQYASEVILNREEFINKIKQSHSNFEIDFSKEDCIKILEYTEANRVKKVKMGNIELSGVEVRTLIGLKSANFKIDIEDNNIKFSVIGYGHGVGMSQTGADSMAKQGSNFEQIIKHFYTGVEIVNL